MFNDMQRICTHDWETPAVATVDDLVGAGWLRENAHQPPPPDPKSVVEYRRYTGICNRSHHE
jgi:hypothetical protein